MIASFPFRDEELENSEFPKKFPFSPMVPRVYHEVKEFIYACLKFSEDLNLTQTEIDEMICKSTNLLLTRTFSGCLSSLFRKPSLALLQVVQIIINTGYLEKTTKYLEEFVSNITGFVKFINKLLFYEICLKINVEVENLYQHINILLNRKQHDGQSNTSGLKSAMFRVARDDAEKQICDKLNLKLDEFLGLENYDWTLTEPQGHASGFITDLIAFLQSTFTCFTNLPVSPLSRFIIK